MPAHHPTSGSRLRVSYLVAGTLLATFPSLHAATLSLDSTMNGDSFIAEANATGGFSRINLGSGQISTGAGGYIASDPANPLSGDRDGHYRWNGTADPATIVVQNTTNAGDGYPLGSGWDLFPREANFLIGSLTFDAGLVSLTGVSNVAITSIDLGEFWKNDPNRTASSPGVLPSVISDISDRELGLWFFDMDGDITFGALDANDTLTFTDGVLTSIDLSLTTVFNVGNAYLWNGTFSIAGDQISYQIDDASPGFRLVADLTGDVNAVGVYTVPEPSSLGLLALAGTAFGSRRFRRKTACLQP